MKILTLTSGFKKQIKQEAVDQRHAAAIPIPPLEREGEVRIWWGGKVQQLQAVQERCSDEDTSRKAAAAAAHH